ncbi:MAG: site-specific integrase [Bacteroides sp.]|nr:site-specific integrase [Bacteroides sp.]
MDKDSIGVFVTLRSRKRKSGNQSLYLDITQNGVRHTEYLKLYITGGKSRKEAAKDKETMRMAEIIKSQRILELQNERLGFKRTDNSKSRILLTDYIDKLIKERPGKTTSQHWRNMKRRVIDYSAGKSLFLDEITKDWVKGFKSYLNNSKAFDIDSHKRCPLNRSLAEGTKALLFNKFTTIFRCALKDGYLDHNPALGIKGFEEAYAPREFLTIDELKKLTKCKPPHREVCDAFIFSCLTGLRWSDIVNLKWDNVQEMNGYTRLVFKQQKTRALEYLDLTPQAAAMIGHQRGKDKVSVFTNLTTVQHTRSYVMAWIKSAGIQKHITFHCARHTFATMLLTLDVNIHTVQKLLGHKSLATTEIYAKLLDKNKQEAVGKIPNIL